MRSSRRARTRAGRAALVFLAVPPLLAAGCQAGYVLEQGCRQLQLGRRTVPLDSPQIARDLAPEAVEKLHWVPRILDFARQELGLDPGDSYQTFLDTGGKPVTYVVSASHPLALIPYQWSFPFVGT